MRVLMVPGIGGSGPDHWQTRWESAGYWPSVRIRPTSWDEPDADDWLAAVRRGAAEAGPDAVIIAHSLGCLCVAELVAGSGLACRAVVLVAPPDVDGPDFPTAVTGFGTLAQAPITPPGLLITSTDDPYCTPAASARLAARWGVDHLDVGPHGHLNATSGHGDWPEGVELVRSFLAGE